VNFPPLSAQVRAGTRIRIAQALRRVISPKGDAVARSRRFTELRSEAGPLVHLSTGRVVVWDPSDLAGAAVKPSAIQLAPGRYRTQFLFKKKPMDVRVAFAILWIQPQQPHRFVPAPRVDEREETLGPGESFAAGTDSAMLCFVDMEFCEACARAAKREQYLEPGTRAEEAMRGKDFAEFYLSGVGTAVAFSSGFGDGRYSKCWGVAESGAPVCLVVDLAVVATDLWD
jgi:hypothetical protein